jgi:hypothetical protein
MKISIRKTKGNDRLGMPSKFNFRIAVFECTNGIRTHHNWKPIEEMACTPLPIPMPFFHLFVIIKLGHITEK